MDYFPNCKKAVEEAGINFHWKRDKINDILQTQISDRFQFKQTEDCCKIVLNHNAQVCTIQIQIHTGDVSR